MTYVAIKTYGHEVGLSCAFRQWRARSHCRYLHGYALAVRLEFETNELDEHGWVVDFGGLKEVRAMLEEFFDHKTLVAEDDPHLHAFTQMHELGIIDMRLVPQAGCEAFARLIFEGVNRWLIGKKLAPRVRLRRVEVREHGANGAMMEAPQIDADGEAAFASRSSGSPCR